MVVVVDRREPEWIVEKLSARGVEVYIGTLDVGDYVVGDILIERKKGLDLHRSLVDGRLWDELYRMKNTDMKPCLAIVDPFETSENVPEWVKANVVTADEYVSAAATAMMSFGASVVTLDSDDDFIKFVERLYRRTFKRSTRPVLKSKKTTKTIDDIKFDILTSIPGIGSRTATELLKRYSIADLLEMSETDINRLKINGRSVKKQIMKLREAVEHGRVSKN